MPEQEKSVFQLVCDGINKIATLTVETTVGKAIPDDNGGYKSENSDDSLRMYSSIDLLQGDMKTIIPKEFTEGSLSSLRQFHQNKEEMGRQIIKENIECLQELIELYREANKDNK